MKKLLFVLALGAFAACGSGENAENKTDSNAAVIDSSANAAIDSTKAHADSTVKVIDSTAAAKKDSVKH
ncbi:hypothetical protein [Filimonas effusa]|uniref:Entericidin n=1 Tax=Filimonas effusa TaxID=2508721 RepID=A0A4V1M9C3_9BACT|nr:hypothetical protein [Filimonas effusa]RXK80559.1 hypothetical protein ESB13_23275 [Filimonas effusa]